MHFTLLYGSYRDGRTGIRAVRFLQRHLKSRGHEVAVVDAKEIDLPMLNKMYKEYPKGSAPEALEQLAETYRNTDGFVVVAGEYNHSIQPGLKNLLDHFLEEYFYRPAAIACYSMGGFGGVRAAVHLRAALAEMGMVTIPSLFPFSKIHASLNEDGSEQEGSYDERVGRFLDELEWYARAMQAERQNNPVRTAA